MKFNVDERIRRQIKNNILIVDENINDQKFLVSTLDKTNYAFICCENIDKGFETLIEDKNIISLVILDLSIDSKKGLEFMEKRLMMKN